MMWGNGTGWGGWLIMSITMVAFWALVLFGIVALFRGRDPATLQDRPQRDARRILDERFARGEIDAEEYQVRLSVLPHTA